MYLPSTKQCDTRNGQTPVPAAEIAAGQMARARINDLVTVANRAWAGVLRRNWRSFTDLGPGVSFQVMNAPIGSSPPSVFRGSSPPLSGPPSAEGVEIVTSDPAAGDGGTRGGSRDGSRGGTQAGTRGGSRDGTNIADFVSRFGRSLLPFQRYTGPLPPQGSAMSLVYGGSASNRPAAVGATPPSMPVAQSGYFSSVCPNPEGVNAIPLGEPFYPDAGGGDSAGSSFGVLGAVVALLGLAGLAYVADRDDKKHGRTKA